MSDTPEPVEKQDDSEIGDLDVSEAAAESVKGGDAQVPASTALKFSASSVLKAEINSTRK